MQPPDAGKGGAVSSLATADGMLDSAVEPHCRRTDATHDLLGEPRRLLPHRFPNLGARRDFAQRMLRLVAREHPVGELERARAGQCRIEEALQLSARGELLDHPLEDSMPYDRASNLLGQRPSERSVDHARDLGS